LAVGFVSAAAILASLVLALLGINARQMNSDVSTFGHHYAGMYLEVAGVIVLAALLAAGFWLQQRRDARHQRLTRPSRGRPWPRRFSSFTHHYHVHPLR
jgi:hypothetical protein